MSIQALVLAGLMVFVLLTPAVMVGTLVTGPLRRLRDQSPGTCRTSPSVVSTTTSTLDGT